MPRLLRSRAKHPNRLVGGEGVSPAQGRGQIHCYIKPEYLLYLCTNCKSFTGSSINEHDLVGIEQRVQVPGQYPFPENYS